jgi:hypothetical protein
MNKAIRVFPYLIFLFESHPRMGILPSLGWRISSHFNSPSNECYLQHSNSVDASQRQNDFQVTAYV